MACACCCTEIGACCTFQVEGNFYQCTSRKSCECDSNGGWFLGAGTSCSGSPCSSFTPSTFCCNGCTFPSSVNVSLTATATDFELTQQRFSGGRFTQFRSLTNRTLTANLTLVRSGTTCPTYSFSGGCGGSYGDFETLQVTLARSFVGQRCGWRLTFTAEAFGCPIAGFGGTEYACYPGLFPLYGQLSDYQDVVLDSRCPVLGISFSKTSTITVIPCNPANPAIGGCFTVSGCTITGGSYPQTTTTIVWSAQVT